MPPLLLPVTALLLLVATTVSPSLLAADPAPPVSDGAKAAEMATSPGTKVQNVTVDEAERLLKSEKDLVVLDVRTDAEFKEGHIVGAKNVDFVDDRFVENLAALDKSKPILLHCASGARSRKALEKMKALNFSNIYHLEGGMKAWTGAGKAVSKN